MKNSQNLRKPKIFQKSQRKNLLSNGRGLSLYFFPLSLIPASLFSFANGDFLQIVSNISGCASYLLAAFLLRKGILAEIQYQDKKITLPPKWPFKTLATLIVSSTTTWISYLSVGHSFIVSLAFGAGAFIGMLLFYGLDPLKEKMLEGSHGYSAEEISQTISDAETQISGIKDANRLINNKVFNKRILIICDHAHDILDMLEEDPSDIRSARKFLNIYLEGALKVTNGYADMQNKHQSEQLSNNFEAVLKTIESVFVEQKQKLLEDDILDLDVNIEVLAAQLKQEGL